MFKLFETIKSFKITKKKKLEEKLETLNLFTEDPRSTLK